ncbi:MAG: biosynthetic-type acetolactate synthase large subunit [Oscillospiraceae bacterium]|nr:biosynthetic-type acetolactate synthase large subunit [Oscillospiraceae bacterium]
MKSTGAGIIIETLIEHGCDTVFGYPGGQVLSIYDELYKNKDRIEHILCANEQGAAHAADGYARASGKTGVVIATSGPGATNLVTGIATAYLDSVPLVAITGNVPCDLIGKDSFQEVDIAGITIPITKHNYIVKDVARLADTIREAFKIAQSGRKGPVLVDVPKDVQQAECEYNMADPLELMKQPTASDDEINLAAQLISEAQRPYIYCGGGIISSGASDALIRFADLIDAPVATSLMGIGAVPASYSNLIGLQGMHGNYVTAMAQNEADLIIACGARFSDRAIGSKFRYSENTKIIHIDIDAAEIEKNVPVYLGIEADIKDTLIRLCEKVQAHKNTAWLKRIGVLREHAGMLSKSTDEARFSPSGIIRCVNKTADDDTIIATDVGQHQMWTAQYYRFEKIRTFVTSGGLGTMGFGMGAAIGASTASHRRAVLFTGDGSFGMNLNELATAVTYRIPLTVIILNNGVLGMVRQWQTIFYDKRYSCTALNRKTDFVKVAEAFGAVGYHAHNMAEFKKAFNDSYNSSQVCVIDCKISSDEVVLPMLPPDGSVDNIIVSRGEI